MITNRKEIKLYKAKSILDVTEKDSLYCLKADNETEFKIIVTDAFGNPVNLKDLTGGTITNVINTDGSITITGSGVKDIKLSATLYNLINSALQAGDNISSLTNNSGFITLSDIPAFNPLDYDLTDFTNSDTDPFARLSDIAAGSGIDSVVAGTNITVDNTDPLNPIISSTASGATNLGYTPSSTDGTVTSDSGSDATIPLANNTNAGLLSPSEKSDIASAIQPSDLATVATSGDYTDLINIPTEFNPSAHTHPISDIINLQTELDSKLDKNTPIVGATKTKLTYDSNGLVTSGEDALTSDIADSINKRYVTDAQLVVIGNTSGVNTGDNATNSQYSGLATSKQDVLTDIVLGALINGYTSKTTPVGADGFLISNSADSNKAYKVTYTNLSATLKAYFDTIYANPGTIVKRILNSTVETSLLTGTTSETLIYSAPVISGGSFTTNDYFNFQAVFRKQPGNAIGCTYRVYISNTNNFATASLLATWASQRFNTVMERRNLYFKADNTINSTIPATTSTQTDFTNTDAALTSISLNPANDIYFFISAQLGVGTDNVKMTAIKIFN